MVSVKRGDIWLVRLDPTTGSELRKTRPCVIVSPDGLSHLPVHLIVPLTSGSHPSPFRPEIEFEGVTGRLLADQMRSVDRSRLLRKLDVIDPSVLTTLLSALRDMFEE